MLDDQKIVNFVTHVYVMPFSCHVDKKNLCYMIYMSVDELKKII